VSGPLVDGPAGRSCPHPRLPQNCRAEQLAAEDDRDGQFIFLWIAFNAAHATEIDERFRLSEQETFRAFLQKLVNLDAEGKRNAARHRAVAHLHAAQYPERPLVRAAAARITRDIEARAES